MPSDSGILTLRYGCAGPGPRVYHRACLGPCAEEVGVMSDVPIDFLGRLDRMDEKLREIAMELGVSTSHGSWVLALPRLTPPMGISHLIPRTTCVAS